MHPAPAALPRNPATGRAGLGRADRAGLGPANQVGGTADQVDQVGGMADRGVLGDPADRVGQVVLAKVVPVVVSVHREPALAASAIAQMNFLAASRSSATIARLCPWHTASLDFWDITMRFQRFTRGASFL